MKTPALLCACLLSSLLHAQKLDAGIHPGETQHSVFVRLRPQLFETGPDYVRFCATERGTKRSELRSRIITALRSGNDDAWKTVQERFADAGALQDVQRYWIVNGFACRASGDQCIALSELDVVAFVYRQPQPRLPALHARPGAELPERMQKQETALVERMLALRAEHPDEEEPPLEKWQPTFNLERIGAPEAWKLGALGQGIVVALLDTGILPTPALAGALWCNPKEEWNGRDDDGNGFVDDLFGYDFARDAGCSVGDNGRCHGSMCGGIVAGRPVQVGDELLVTGVAPRARLMVLRGMGQLRAYEYALSNGADVISMSYMWVNMELGNWRGLYRLAHEHMSAAGIVAVGGSGNFGRTAAEGKQIALPKDIPCVIAASGLDANDTLPPFSSLGPCSWAGVRFYDDHGPDAPLLKPDVTAYSTGFPLWTLLRAWPERRGRAQHVHDAGDGIGLVVGPAGNSFAGPHAAGVAALMLSANPELPAFCVHELMEASCKELGAKGKDARYGAGLLQAAAAVQAAKKIHSVPGTK